MCWFSPSSFHLDGFQLFAPRCGLSTCPHVPTIAMAMVVVTSANVFVNPLGRESWQYSWKGHWNEELEVRWSRMKIASYILFFTHTYTYSIIIFHLSHTRLYKITYSRFFNEHIDYDGLDQDSSWFTWILPCYCAHRYGADCSLRKCLGTVCYADSSTKDAEEFFSWIFVAKLVIPLSPGAILSWVLFAWQMR